MNNDFPPRQQAPLSAVSSSRKSLPAEDVAELLQQMEDGTLTVLVALLFSACVVLSCLTSLLSPEYAWHRSY